METKETINTAKSNRGGYREGSGSQSIDFEPRSFTLCVTATEREHILQMRKDRGLSK